MTEDRNAEMLSAEAGFLEAMQSDGVREIYGKLRRNKENNVRGWRGAEIIIPSWLADAGEVPTVTGRIGGMTDNMHMIVIGQSRRGGQRKFEIQVEFDRDENPVKVADIKEATSQTTEESELSDEDKTNVMAMTTKGLEKAFRKRG